MRRYLTGFVVAAVTAVVPALALAGNQEVAQQIASRLSASGQLSTFKVGVKYQDGTAWLRGYVASEEQKEVAMKVALQTPGVKRVINEMSLADEPAAEDMEQTATTTNRGRTEANPLREANRARRPSIVERLGAAFRGNSAERVPSSYAQSQVEQTSAEEPQELPRQTAAPMRTAMMQQPGMVRGPVAPNGGPMPTYMAAHCRAGGAAARYDQPCLPNYAWPSYAAYPNYAAVTYPKQYSPTAWPYIGPFYPYPQVPLGWRKVTLEWDDGWWFLDFKDQPSSPWHR
ncbi:MAG: BON domain-containing protein [Thermoguttaceae bacterium]